MSERPLTKSEREERHQRLYDTGPIMWREHRYVGGPPNPRIKRMQLAHETRARQAGVKWDIVDLRQVYRHYSGRCGICGELVGLDVVAFDHIVPLAHGGPHVFKNLQPAHLACNTRKGNRRPYPMVGRLP